MEEISAEQYYRLGEQKFHKKKFQEAIDAFNNALAIKENWKSYLGLGIVLNCIGQHKRAVDAFEKSLSIKVYWQSYQGLGIAFNYMGQYQTAVDAFNKSLALNKHWQSYLGLGMALMNMKQYQTAVDAFNKSLALRENMQTYHFLGSALNKINESEKAVLAAKEFYFLNKILGYIKTDPLMGEKEGVIAGRDFIEDLTNMLLRNNFLFHPSFYSKDTNSIQLMPWKHLIHIHIPKCAGTNFERPLIRLMQSSIRLKNSKQKSFESQEKDFLWHGNLKEKYLLDGYLMEINSRNCLNRLHGSLFVDHGSGHESYFKTLAESGINAKKICLTRDPSERLYSHIKHYARNITEKKELRETCLKELSNVMLHFIFEYSKNHEGNESVYQQNSTRALDSIEFIDISNQQLITKIKSSFLSANTLPNIVQYHRLNDFGGERDDKANFQEQDFRDIYHELIEQGFLRNDFRIDFESLHQRTKEKLEFPELIDTSEFLHPITYIFRKNEKSNLMLTKDFLANPLSAIN